MALALITLLIAPGCNVDDINNALAPFFGQEPVSSPSQRPVIVSGRISSSSGSESTGASSPSSALEGEDAQTKPPEETPLPPIDDSRRPALFYPYRAMLNDNQKRAYDEICTHMENMKGEFVLEAKVTLDEIRDVLSAVCYDNPDFFWMRNQYTYHYNNNQIVTQINVEFNETANYIERAKQEFNAAANKILDGAKPLKSDIEKVKYVHDTLLHQTQTIENAALNQSAYSALVNGKTVCAGYTRAMQYLLMQLGIPSYFCVGKTNEDHAWNINKIGDHFYNLDMAWDDPVGNPADEYHYEYFNLTDKQIEADHTRTEMSVKLPACDNSEYGYDEYFGDGDPMTRVQKGGTMLSYRDFGYTSQDVVQSLQDYYDRCHAILVAQGAGSHQSFFVVKNRALLSEIYAGVQREGWYSGFVTPAARELGMENYSATISANARELADGYYLLSQTLDFR